MFSYLSSSVFSSSVVFPREKISELLNEKLFFAELLGKRQAALRRAAEQGWTEEAQQLIQYMVSHQEELASKDDQGRTALYIACDRGYTEIVQALIAKMRFEDLASRDNGDRTALHVACLQGHREIAGILINRMSPEQVALKDRDSQTALDIVSERKYTDIIRLIQAVLPEKQGAVRPLGL